MNVHEYQAKELLARHGVNVPRGEAVKTPEEATTTAEAIWSAGHTRAVVKSQIHAGGRGKGTFKDGFQGGVHLCDSVEDVTAKAEAMLGNVLVTKQTGEDGRQVNTLLISSAEEITKEFYLACLLDRGIGRPILMASAEGGMDIEEVAAKTPEKIIKVAIDPTIGLQDYQARKVAIALGLRGKLIGQAARLFKGVYNTWFECDASLVEINPLAVTLAPDGSEVLAAVDAKLSVDDNALFRHPDIAEMRDLGEEDELEVEASKHDLNYIKLDGNIACLVNGAGLAMSTMDTIKHHGGEPANFLDVGGGATKERVTEAFKIILSDSDVDGVLVNIFGGIMRCDVIAEGIVSAAREVSLEVPLVVRLEGTNVDLGKKILAESGLSLVTADHLADAAEKIVKAVER